MSGYSNALEFAAGAFLLSAVLIVWRRKLTAIITVLAVQGLLLAALPLIQAFHNRDIALAAIGVLVLALRAGFLPWLLTRAVDQEDGDSAQSRPLVNTTTSLLVAAALTIAAFAVTRPLVRLDPSAATRAVPSAVAVVLLGLFLMISRRRALSQAVGFLMLDNGIAATAFLLTAGVPLIIELGASLDVLFAVLVLGILTGRLRHAFGDTDLDQLRELHD